MPDRAGETIAAMAALKTQSSIDVNRIGLIGYSQAGWVLPLVAEQTKGVDFMILVSGAINWLEQGAYLTATRLASKGHSQSRINLAVEEYRSTIEKYFAPSSTYDQYLSAYPFDKAFNRDNHPPMTPERFHFVKLNWRSDARES
jgi:dienelactone hydrolase